MNKLRKVIQGLIALIRNPWLLNNILADSSIWQRKLALKYKVPNGFPVIQFTDICKDKEDHLDYYSFLDGGSLPTDLILLKQLCGSFDNCKYFEIGTWRGESVANVAQVADQCYTLNLSKSDIIQLGNSQKYADSHGYYSKDIPNVTHLYGNSQTYDFGGLSQKFDVIFIDGSHHFDHIVADTMNVFRHLVHDRSIVVWHDYGFTPEKLRPEVIAAILEGTPTELQSNLYHVANTKCAIFTKANYTTSVFKPNMLPKDRFEISVKF